MNFDELNKYVIKVTKNLVSNTAETSGNILVKILEAFLVAYNIESLLEFSANAN